MPPPPKHWKYKGGKTIVGLKSSRFMGGLMDFPANNSRILGGSIFDGSLYANMLWASPTISGTQASSDINISRYILWGTARLGTPPLQVFLSDSLISQFSESVPSVEKDNNKQETALSALFWFHFKRSNFALFSSWKWKFFSYGNINVFRGGTYLFVDCRFGPYF